MICFFFHSARCFQAALAIEQCRMACGGHGTSDEWLVKKAALCSLVPILSPQLRTFRKANRSSYLRVFARIRAAEAVRASDRRLHVRGRDYGDAATGREVGISSPPYHSNGSTYP